MSRQWRTRVVLAMEVVVMMVGLALFLGSGAMAKEVRVRSLLFALRKSPFFWLVFLQVPSVILEKERIGIYEGGGDLRGI